MSNIEFQAAAADVENINIRKKGKEAERQSIVDVTMECEVPADVIKFLVMSKEVPDLWDKKGDKKFTGISSINSIVRFENHSIKIGDLMFEDVELKSFSFNPIGSNRAQVKFTVTLFAPNEHQIGVLVNSYKESAPIEVIASQQSDIED